MPFDIEGYIGQPEEELDIDKYIGEPITFDVDEYIREPTSDWITKLSAAFGPSKEYREVYAPELGRMVPGTRIETPIGTKILERLKFEWETDWPTWIGMGIFLGTYGGLKALPAISESIISKNAAKFAKNNLPVLKKQFPDVIKTGEDARLYAELAMKGKLGPVSEKLGGLRSGEALQVIRKLSNQIGNLKVTAAKAVPTLPAVGEKVTAIDKLIPTGLERVGAETLAGIMQRIGKPVVSRVADEAVVLATTEERAELRRLIKETKIPSKRFLGIMQALTGRKDVKAITESEAGIMINALHSTPRTKTAGQIKLSTRTDLIPSDYYQKKKRAVALGMQLVPAWRMMEWIGVKEEVYDPVEEAIVNLGVEEADKFHTFAEWRKRVGRSPAIAKKLSRYVNGLIGDEAMTPTELEITGEIKSLMDEYADRMGLPLEKRKKHYMIHLFDAMSRHEIAKANPLPDEFMDALDFSVPKTIFTSTLLHRFDRKQGLIENIWKELRAVTAIDLRRIHLEPALQVARAYITRGYIDKEGVMHPMPKTSRDYIRNWINIAVLKKHAKLDDLINVLANPVSDFMTKYTRGRVSMGSNPAQTLARATTSLGYAGAMTLNVAIAGKNLTQQFLIPPLLSNPANYMKAWAFRFTDGGRMLLKESLTLKARFPMEMFDPKDVRAIFKYGMLAYRGADWINVSQAFLSGYLDAIGQKMPYAEAIKYADRVAKVSQFSYRRPDMPEFMTKFGALGRQAGQFQTWVANYWFNYMPELSYRLATGKGTDGKPVTLSQRAGLLSYIALTSAFIYGMYKYAKVDFRKIFGPGVIPTNLAPGVALNLAIGQKLHGLATGDYRAAREGNRKLSRSIPIFIPVDLQVEKVRDAYQKLTEGLERDSYGRIRRDVTTEEAIRGIFTYPAERSEFWRVQNKVWDLGLQIGEVQKKLQNPTLTFKQKEKLADELRKKSIELVPYKRDLARLTQGLPAEETNQQFIDQMKWIMLRR